MYRNRPEPLVTQSLLDRLRDHWPADEPWPQTRQESERRFRNSLKRDVEWLLNSRQPLTKEAAEFPAASASVINYGLPDIQSFDGSPTQRAESMSRALEECLRAFEPRIHQPRVSMNYSDPLTRHIRFQVEGRVTFEDSEEEIKFDTVLELISGEYEVN